MFIVVYHCTWYDSFRTGDGERPGPDGREQVEEELRGDVGGAEAEVVQHLEDVAAGTVAVVVSVTVNVVSTSRDTVECCLCVT